MKLKNFTLIFAILLASAGAVLLGLGDNLGRGAGALTSTNAMGTTGTLGAGGNSNIAGQMASVPTTYWRDNFNSLTDVPQGQGSVSVPFVIENERQLAYIAAQINNGNYGGDYNGANFVVVHDFDMSGHLWTPIGTDTNRVGSASFDFGNHTVRGITVVNNAGGLFGYVQNELMVKNLVIEDIYVNNVGAGVGVYAGGVLGYVGTRAVIDNVSVNGFVSGVDYVAGFCAVGRAEIRNSVNYATVSGRDYVGGFCGYSPTTVFNCENYGAVSGASAVGGIVGHSEGGNFGGVVNRGVVRGENGVGGVVGIGNNVTIADAKNYGDITATNKGVGGILGSGNIEKISRSVNYGAVSGDTNVGGLAGSGFGNADNCSNQGAVVASGFVVGGLSGICSGSVTACYNTGAVAGSRYVGGLFGVASGNVTNCFNYGVVSGESVIGGIAGSVIVRGGTVTFADINNNGQILAADLQVADKQMGGIVGLVEYSGLPNANYSFAINCAVSYFEYDAHDDYTAGIVGAVVISSNLVDSDISVRLDLIECHYLLNRGNSLVGEYVEHENYAYFTRNLARSVGQTAAELAVRENYLYTDFTANGRWAIDASVNDGVPYLKTQMFGYSFKNPVTGAAVVGRAFVGEEVLVGMNVVGMASVTAYTFMGFEDHDGVLYIEDDALVVCEDKALTARYVATKYLIEFYSEMGTPFGNPSLQTGAGEIVANGIISIDMGDMFVVSDSVAFKNWQIMGVNEAWANFSDIARLPISQLFSSQVIENYMHPLYSNPDGAMGKFVFQVINTVSDFTTYKVSTDTEFGGVYLGGRLMNLDESDYVQVGRGSSVTLQAVPDKFYEVASVEFMGGVTGSIVAGANGFYTITTAAENATLKVNFKKIDYSVRLVCFDEENNSVAGAATLGNGAAFSVGEVSPISLYVNEGMGLRFNGFRLFNLYTQKYDVFSVDSVVYALDLSAEQLDAYIGVGDTELVIYGWFVTQQQLDLTFDGTNADIELSIFSGASVVVEYLTGGTYNYSVDNGSYVFARVIAGEFYMMNPVISGADARDIIYGDEYSFVITGAKSVVIDIIVKDFAVVMGGFDEAGNRLAIADDDGVYPITFVRGWTEISDITFTGHSNYRLLYFALKTQDEFIKVEGGVVPLTEAYLSGKLNQYGEIQLVAVLVRTYNINVSVTAQCANMGTFEVYVEGESVSTGLRTFDIGTRLVIKMIPANVHFQYQKAVGMTSAEVVDENLLTVSLNDNRAFSIYFEPVTYAITKKIDVKGSGTVTVSSDVLRVGDIVYITFDTSGLWDVKNFFINGMNVTAGFDNIDYSNNVVVLTVTQDWLDGNGQVLDIWVETRMNDMALGIIIGAAVLIPVLILLVIIIAVLNKKQYNATKAMLYEKRDVSQRRDAGNFIKNLREGEVGNITDDDIKNERKK